MIDRATWVDYVRSFVGVPYHHQGRSIFGMDCVAPLIVAGRHFGIVGPEFDVTSYPRDPDGALMPLLDMHLVRKTKDELQPGDVVLNGFRMRPPQHVAIIVGERYGQWELMHADARIGKAHIERIQYGRQWRYVQGYGVPGVA